MTLQIVSLYGIAALAIATPAFAESDPGSGTEAHISASVISAVTCTLDGCDTPKDTVPPERITEVDGGILYVY